MGLFSCGFAGTILLSASISPAVKRSPSITMNPSSVVISPSQGFVHVVLTITTFHSTILGNYTVTVTATGGTETYSVIVAVTIVREPHLVWIRHFYVLLSGQQSMPVRAKKTTME